MLKAALSEEGGEKDETGEEGISGETKDPISLDTLVPESGVDTTTDSAPAGEPGPEDGVEGERDPADQPGAEEGDPPHGDALDITHSGPQLTQAEVEAAMKTVWVYLLYHYTE